MVTLAVMAACVLVFLYELTLRGLALDVFVRRWGAVPQDVLTALAGDPRVPPTALLRLLTSQFLHGGFLHLGGNMLFLWVFGRAVEDRFGHALYGPFYLLTGAFAGLVQCLVEGPRSLLPLVGASGAVAGVLGAYLVSYPRAWVTVLMPVLFFFWTFDLPAVLVLAIWFVGQFFSGLAAITPASHATAGAVAVWAHVAGFLVGMGAAPLLPQSAPSGRAAAGPRPSRRAAAPGPPRLVSSVAHLLALLAARLVLRFLGAPPPRSPLAGPAGTIFAATDPVVGPFAALFPLLHVGGLPIETYTLAAILAVYLVAGLLGRLVAQG